MSLLNETHDPSLRSWVASANTADGGFPVQNLPYAIFRPAGSGQAWRPAVAIGTQMVDLAMLARAAPFPGPAADALAACQGESLNALMALTPAHWSALRLELSRALRQGSSLQDLIRPMLAERNAAEFSLPARIGDYTDFYISLHHATAVGKLFRPDNPLLPNYKWVPIGYHGRASSIGVSGQRFHRPVGQTRPADADGTPGFGPCRRLDYELELGVLTGQGNALGQRIALDEAEDHAFGLCLLNDWSARDIQAWEYQPLGPFLAKNFASTVSPWVVTLEALAPFRVPFSRPSSDPQPMPYLDSERNRARGAFDISLDVQLSTRQSRAAGAEPATLSRSNFKYAYWTIAQMIAHHSVNGCNLQPGDLLGTGTQSGPNPGQEGSLLELNQGGKHPVPLPWGETRTFLEDHDEVILRAACRKEGYPTIGFGQCAGTVLPSLA